MVKMKRRLTHAEEFEILKLVLDKFLWLGFGIMVYGLYTVFSGDFPGGLTWIVVGSIVLILFLMIIIKEYEILG
ncbi:hypothetical protein GOV09_04800 [Candidatus Woesearchaeota archaeon]|nr:hypothetical protein [Candidatus Woesearchaeota archaeon]